MKLEIWGSDGGDLTSVCSGLWHHVALETYRRFEGMHWLYLQSNLHMETASLPRTSVNLYQTTHRHIPEDSSLSLLTFLYVAPDYSQLRSLCNRSVFVCA